MHPEHRPNDASYEQIGLGYARARCTALAKDLDSGAWAARNAELLDLESIDLGARLLIAAGTP
jgi:hypothetical protein